MSEWLEKKRPTTARTVTGKFLGEELRKKIMDMAREEGKSFDEVLEKVVADGLAVRDEIRKAALTPSIREEVLRTLTLDEVKKVMDKTTELWMSWTDSTDQAIKFVAKGTPVEEEEKTPVSEKTDAWSIHEQFEKRVLEEMGEEEGKPILPEGSEQTQSITKKTQQQSSPFHDMLSGIGKYAIDKLLNPDTLAAVTKLLKDNPQAQKGIGILLDLINEFAKKEGGE